MPFQSDLDKYVQEGKIPAAFKHGLEQFLAKYLSALPESAIESKAVQDVLKTMLDAVADQAANSYTFEPFHKSLRSPIDYYHFGLEFFRPLIDFKSSRVLGLENVQQMAKQMKEQENVILLANHQIEPDPQVINLLLEKDFHEFAQEIIFIAGHRVISDPFAIPFTKGCNVLCIYSKRYVDNPPELKQQKLLHNIRTMERMNQLLTEGGRCIYVAASGGRDRLNMDGVVELAAFDPANIEMFWLMAKQSKRPTHFYPLALSTYDMVPPPLSISQELGEDRNISIAAVHASFGKEIDMHNFPGCEATDKKLRRLNRSEYIYGLVKTLYNEITNVV